jgi:MraZ protein
VELNGGRWSTVGQSKFIGKFDHTLDDKYRLIIPSKFREPLGHRFYLLRSVNAECLWIMTEPEFESYLDEVSGKIPKTDIAGQKWYRLFTASAVLCEMDKQWRVNIPQSLREEAKIEDSNVTLVGVRDHIELWSTTLWREQEEEDFVEQTKSIFEKYGL